MDNVIIYTLTPVCWMLSSSFTFYFSFAFFMMFNKSNLKNCEVWSAYFVHIFPHFYMYFTSSLADVHTPTRARTSWPLTVAGLSIMISPVKCDPAAWSCIQQSAMATGSFKSALTNGQGWQWISRLEGCLSYHSTSRHYYSHWVCLQAAIPAQSSSHLLILYSSSVSLFLLFLITCNSKPESKMF